MPIANNPNSTAQPISRPLPTRDIAAPPRWIANEPRTKLWVSHPQFWRMIVPELRLDSLWLNNIYRSGRVECKVQSWSRSHHGQSLFAVKRSEEHTSELQSLM